MDEENDKDIETPVEGDAEAATETPVVEGIEGVEAAIEEGVEVLETLCEQEQGKDEAADPIPVPEPKPDKPQADAREHQRFLINWRAAIILGGAEEKSTFYGRAHDISVDGASFCSDYSIQFTGAVILLLALPALNAGQKEQILEIRCKIVYCRLSRQLFRVGLKFLGFKGEEKKLLEARINNRVNY